MSSVFNSPLSLLGFFSAALLIVPVETTGDSYIRHEGNLFRRTNVFRIFVQQLMCGLLMCVIKVLICSVFHCDDNDVNILRKCLKMD